MCIKINLKQAVLARLFFFVIYDDKIPFMHLRWGEEGFTLLTLRVKFSLRPAQVPLGDSTALLHSAALWRHVTSVSSDSGVRKL